MKNDFLFIDNLELSSCIGTTPEERAFPQILNVSIEVDITLEKASRTDDIKDTADYASFIETARKVAAEKTFNLVESLAGTIADELLLHPFITTARIRISKKVFTGVGGVGVFISREKNKRA